MKEKEALEEFKNSDNFKGDANIKQTIFKKFRNFFTENR